MKRGGEDMGLIFRCTVCIVVSAVLVCVLAPAACVTSGTAVMSETARQQADEQTQGEESLLTGSIEGSVTDAETGRPLAYANVVLFGSSLGAMTEKDGLYSIPEVPPGKYAVMACMMGYVGDTLCMVEVQGGNPLRLSFELVPAEPDTIPIIIDDSEQLCEIHGVPIDMMWVPIVDEPVEYDEAYERARRLIFPHAGVEIYNPCLSRTLDRMIGFGCPACTEARRIWLKYRR